MSRVLSFSRHYPAYHPNAGQPTNFVEKIIRSLPEEQQSLYAFQYGLNCARYGIAHGLDSLAEAGLFLDEVSKFQPKGHTIRNREKRRWEVGQKFSPRVWGGIPYRSKQIIMGPDIEILKTWDFDMDLNGVYSINNTYVLNDKVIERLAANDGLTSEDMFHWLMPDYDKPKAFAGQIICWNAAIDYPEEELIPC